MEEEPRTSSIDGAVFGVCEVLALLFVLPFGERLYNSDRIIPVHYIYLGLGLCFAALGPGWPYMRRRFPANRWVLSIGSLATDVRIWVAVLLFGFLYSFAPDVYQRAMAPTQPTAVYVTLGVMIGVVVMFVVLVARGYATSAASSRRTAPVSPSGLQITIVSPAEGATLSEGETQRATGKTYVVRGKITGSLPNGYSIWIVNEDPFSKKIWPQDHSSISVGQDGGWDGRTHLSPNQENVTIVAVVASPTVHEFFAYYYDVMRQTGKVIALNRLPHECEIVDRKHALQKIEKS